MLLELHLELARVTTLVLLVGGGLWMALLHVLDEQGRRRSPRSPVPGGIQAWR